MLLPRAGYGERGNWEQAKAVSIADLSAAYGKRLKQGSNRCPFPFHHDAKASFLYNSAQNRFICFGCSHRGSSIDFISALLGLSPREAVAQILGRDGGIRAFPARKQKLVTSNISTDNKLDPELYEAFLAGCRLQSSGLSYLKNRAITQPTIDHFSVGQLSSPTELLKSLTKQFGTERVLKSGLAHRGVRGVNFVFPKDSLIFPFMDGKSCTYLQARSIDISRNELRWLGLKSIAKKVFNMAALDAAIVYICEGITDVLSAHELGYSAIATLGASQGLPVNIIKELTAKTVYIVGDNDDAGRKMAESTSKRLAKSGVASKIQKVPVGNDLNDYLIHLRAGNGPHLQGTSPKLR